MKICGYIMHVSVYENCSIGDIGKTKQKIVDVILFSEEMWQLFGRHRIVIQRYYYWETDSYKPYGFFLNPFAHYHFVCYLHIYVQFI